MFSVLVPRARYAHSWGNRRRLVKPSARRFHAECRFHQGGSLDSLVRVGDKASTWRVRKNSLQMADHPGAIPSTHSRIRLYCEFAGIASRNVSRFGSSRAAARRLRRNRPSALFPDLATNRRTTTPPLWKATGIEPDSCRPRWSDPAATS